MTVHILPKMSHCTEHMAFSKISEMILLLLWKIMLTWINPYILALLILFSFKCQVGLLMYSWQNVRLRLTDYIY